MRRLHAALALTALALSSCSGDESSDPSAHDALCEELGRVQGGRPFEDIAADLVVLGRRYPEAGREVLDAIDAMHGAVLDARSLDMARWNEGAAILAEACDVDLGT